MLIPKRQCCVCNCWYAMTGRTCEACRDVTSFMRIVHAGTSGKKPVDPRKQQLVACYAAKVMCGLGVFA